MRKQCLRILIAVLSVAGLGAAATGQSLDKIAVKVPYEFVVAGKTLPAGNYTVDRVTDGDPRALVLSSFDNHVSAIFLATDVEDSPAGKDEVSFEKVGGQHFVSQIKTSEHVFTIPVTRSEILEAAARSNSGASGEGRSGGSK
jgi:hypothetical protein